MRAAPPGASRSYRRPWSTVEILLAIAWVGPTVFVALTNETRDAAAFMMFSLILGPAVGMGSAWLVGQAIGYGWATALVIILAMTAANVYLIRAFGLVR